MTKAPANKDTKLNVLVTGVGGRSTGHQILQALLQEEKKYNVVATDADAFLFGLYQTRRKYLIPRADSKEYMPALFRLIAAEKIDVILPGTEPEVHALAARKEEVEKQGCRLIINPQDVVDICSNKWRLSLWLSENGLDSPGTVKPGSWKELAAAKGFPIVGKPTEGTGASRNVAILNNSGEVAKYLEEMKDREIIFQEYVGSAEDEYTVGVLASKEGEIIDSIVIHRKLMGLSMGESRMIDGRPFALSTGYSQGFVVRDKTMQDYCEALALKLGARGPLNIQCRRHKGEIKVFEVHPRFSGTTSIRAKVGFNEPDVLIRNFLLGERFSRIDYRADMAAIRAFENLVVPIEALNGIPKA